MFIFIKKVVFDFIVNFVASSFITPRLIRNFLYRLAGININTKKIKSRCYINSKHISIGEGTFINQYSKFFSYNNKGVITIGENCYIGMNTLFCTNSHEIADLNCRAGRTTFNSIIVENGCWIGANTTILPGITVSEGCVLAAGALVNKDCQPNGLYAGVPAKRIKDLQSGENNA